MAEPLRGEGCNQKTTKMNSFSLDDKRRDWSKFRKVFVIQLRCIVASEKDREFYQIKMFKLNWKTEEKNIYTTGFKTESFTGT